MTRRWRVGPDSLTLWPPLQTGIRKHVARSIAARRDLHVNAHAVARVCPPEHVMHVIETLYPDLVGRLGEREVQAIVALAIQPL